MRTDRNRHQQELRGFLQKHLSAQSWSFSQPLGTGMETYFAQGDDQTYFVKVGAPVGRYLAIAEIGITPPILAVGQLEDGSSVIVQPCLRGRRPSRRDYRDQLESVAELIRKIHHHLEIKGVLEPAPSNLHQAMGLRALDQLCQRWKPYRAQVPNVAEFVDHSLEVLAQEVQSFSTEGLVASHGDICNANWLFASDGKIYLLDFESMSLDDPALDLGALLWWYYPPELRQRFVDIAGYPYDSEFRFRMQVRMSMHCLKITLPREQSFDSFDPNHYAESLQDFRAILAGDENPQGYA
jgi:thiamine kinase-like enzyme